MTPFNHKKYCSDQLKLDPFERLCCSCTYYKPKISECCLWTSWTNSGNCNYTPRGEPLKENRNNGNKEFKPSTCRICGKPFGEPEMPFSKVDYCFECSLNAIKNKM